MADALREIAEGDRFEFGRNWARFLDVLDDRRIRQAELSLTTMLQCPDLVDRSFLDVGSGSGLFSLAARRLGARVHSFDFDPQSVACTRVLKARYFPNDDEWTIEQASALDRQYLDQLGTYDVVYSWGVLHHTGEMWQALNNVKPLVAAGGKLYIAIYNHQRVMTPVWSRVKRAYNRLPRGTRWMVVAPALIRLWGPRTLYDLFRGRPFYTWRHYSEHSLRGMSAWRDVIDWVGGYPFEVAKPEEILDIFRADGFQLERMTTRGGGLGCNEYVFTYYVDR